MTTVEIIVEGEGLVDVATIAIEEGSTWREIGVAAIEPDTARTANTSFVSN